MVVLLKLVKVSAAGKGLAGEATVIRAYAKSWVNKPTTSTNTLIHNVFLSAGVELEGYGGNAFSFDRQL